MKDFDIERRKREEADRTFQIGGEVFAYRAAVAPESILSWTEFASVGDKEQAAVNAARAQLAAAQSRLDRLDTDEAAHPDGPPNENRAQYEDAVADLAAKVAEKTEELATVARSEGDWLNVIDDTVLAIIEPEYGDTWRKVRDPGVAHPLSLGDLQAMLEWLMAEVTGRPTGQPSDSSPSDGSTETTSTVESSSTEAPEPESSTSDS